MNATELTLSEWNVFVANTKVSYAKCSIMFRVCLKCVQIIMSKFRRRTNMEDKLRDVK